MRPLRSGSLSGYRERVRDACFAVLETHGPIASAIDVGAGEGWYAAQFLASGLVRSCVAAEVQLRATREIDPVLYDGARLPFRDGAFELAYAIDVAHHAKNPSAFLQETARVSSRWVLLKDHTFSTVFGRLALYALDLAGNTRFGINSPGKYQRDWQWLDLMNRQSFRLVFLEPCARCHTGLLGRLTNSLQFVALFERVRG